MQDNQQAGTPLQPYVTPADFGPAGRIDLVLARYRVIGSQVVPITQNLTDSITQAFASLYGVPSLPITIPVLVSSPSAPTISANYPSGTVSSLGALIERTVIQACTVESPNNQMQPYCIMLALVLTLPWMLCSPGCSLSLKQAQCGPGFHLHVPQAYSM